jgi:DNA (cytosine-5)-methyltransferase 1
MNELALFAGAGGGILGGKLLGWRTVCAVEWEPYAACVLVARQNDKILPHFPIWDDVQTFDGKPWRGIVDVISGGFPCQDISAAGKGAGIDGERSGMWKEMARIIGEVRPKYVFVENSPMLTSRGLGTVLGDLASMGFDAKWGVLGAADVGAPHQRDRIWIRACLSNSDGLNDAVRRNSQNHAEGMVRRGDEPRGSICNSGTGCQEGSREGSGLADTEDKGDVWRQWVMGFAEQEHDSTGGKANGCGEWWKTEPNVGRVADGVAARVDRLKAIGNGQVPLCAATAWRILK